MSASPNWSPTSPRSHDRAAAWDRIVTAAPPTWVLEHVRAVEGLAVAMAKQAQVMGLDVDVELVSVGALLHDIGRCKTQGLDHAPVGADLLRQPPPWPEPVCRVVETHTGAGLVPDEAEAAGLPARDYVPRSLEERIVAHADNLFTGTKRLTVDEVVAKYERKGLGAAGKRIVDLHEALCRELGCDVEGLEPVDRERA